MDLAEIIRQAQQRASQDSAAQNGVSESLTKLGQEKLEILKTAAILCECGHEELDHTEGETCEIEGCICINYFPRTESYDINPDKSEQKIQAGSADIVVDILDQPIEEAEIIEHYEASQPSKDITEVAGESSDPAESGCHHMCEKCDLWFSHGTKLKCRHPDLVRFGICGKCLEGGTKPIDPLADFDEDRLTPVGILKAKNETRITCKDMTIEQITNHILFVSKQIEQLRVKGLEARKIRTELEEEQIKNIPEEEREKFLQELRRGQTKRTKKENEKKERIERAAPVSKMEKLIVNMMKTTGKSREEVEKYLND